MKKKLGVIYKELIEMYPEAECELDFVNMYQLFVSTLLSAQTTDKSVNKITPALFKKYPDFAALARAKQADVENIIKTIGLFRNKAKNIIASACRIISSFNGIVPRDFKDIVTLPGIGRKSSVIILGNGYKILEGIAVDTHVARIVHRWGIVPESAKTPDKIEISLMEIVQKKEWVNFSHRVILFGRRICNARKPKCDECPFTNSCDYFKTHVN
ncbi:MAG: endonuclease III [Planctomycetes bacterium]|nr:endonuclease III [Planctomycetota bacterium]